MGFPGKKSVISRLFQLNRVETKKNSGNKRTET